MPYKCSCGFETEVGNAFSAHFHHYKGEEHQRIGWVDPDTGEIFETKPREGRRPKRVGGQEPKTKRGGELGTIVQPGRGTIVFTFGEERIPLNYSDLYDAYQYYRDILREHDIDQDFTSTIKDSVKFVWERFNRARSQGISVTVEEE